MMITKATTDFSNSDFNSGEAILIDKPLRWTSFKAVYEIRKAIEVKKVGHAGTLDPLATGLLIICTGKKTKEITNYQNLEKTYCGTILLGKTSSSMDLETEIISDKPVNNISEKDILSARDKFLGNIAQVPPMYSAVKIGGKNLYKLARKGKSVYRQPRQISISKFDIEISLPEISFEIKCSKGTYLRVIAHDLGEMLGCGGLLSSLRRTQIGNYQIEDALQVTEFIERMKRTGAPQTVSLA